MEYQELPYTEPEFFATWSEWVEYRKEIKKPYKSPKSAQRQLKWFVNHGYNFRQAIELIETAIRNGWQGIWPEKNTSYGYAGNKQQPFPPKQGGTSINRTQGLINW